MKTIFAISFIATVYASPVIAVLTVIAALFAMSVIASFCNQRLANDAVLDAAYDNLKDAFDDIFDDAAPAPDDQPSDIWDATEVNSCPLACSVSFNESYEQPVLALPAGITTLEDAVLVDYTAFSYKQLQAKCRELRTKKNNIRLNSKKSALIEYLQHHHHHHRS